MNNRTSTDSVGIFSYQKIAFIGLGLIGGSIAKAIKEKHPAIKLYALTPDEATIQTAHAEGIIENNTFLTLAEIAKMDIIFLCAPVQKNLDYVRDLAPLLSSDTLLTDVGSVKNEIMREATAAGISDHYIGGHPMTGSEKSGWTSANALLLENAYYILCEDGTPPKEKVAMFGDFISSLGAVVMQLDPKTHDHAVAAISHLPHIIASGLVNTVAEGDNEAHVMRTIAAGGFRDITRIASSSPVMWQSICLENRDEILTLIDMYTDSLAKMRRLIEAGDKFGIFEYFSDAKDYRDNLPIRKIGILPQAFDFYLDLKDETGEIAKVAGLLAAGALNIKNIGIVHNREFENGVLHIEMHDGNDKESAMILLSKHGYHLYTK